MITRVEVLDADGHLAGLFFTKLSLSECLKFTSPNDYRDVPGEWVAAGGSLGPDAWFAKDVRLGEIRELSDD